MPYGITVPSLPGSASWTTRTSWQKFFNMIVKTKHTALFIIWCIALIAAIAGAIYFGLSDRLRLLQKPAGRHERIALTYNLLAFACLMAYLVS